MWFGSKGRGISGYRIGIVYCQTALILLKLLKTLEIKITR